MASSRARLILHPVRIRVLGALARRELTARQLNELLNDVPPATLYAHLGALTRGGLLRVVSERPVRGAVERVYTVAAEHVTLRPEDLAAASREDHLRSFTLFVALLLDGFDRYLHQREPINFIADGVGYAQTPFYLSDEEFIEAATAVNQALLPYLRYEPAPHRRRRLYSTVVFPDPDPSERPEEAGSPSTSGDAPPSAHHKRTRPRPGPEED